MPPEQERKPRRTDEVIDWFTISYRTIYAVVGAVVLVAGVVLYYYFRPVPPPATPSPSPDQALATTARFTSLSGSVKVKVVGSPDWQDANTSAVLRKGDLVRTGRDSAAEITFFDGTVVHIRPDSLITIEETTQNRKTGASRVVWNISSGQADYRAGPRSNPDSTSETNTPSGRVRHGELAQGDINVAASGATDVRVFRGTSDVETKAGQKVTLAPNEGLKVDASGQAAAKVALPAVPVLVSPAPDSELLYANPGHATTLLLWKDVSGAQSYRVMVDFTPQFYRPLVDQVRKGTSVELRGLDVGKYYWKVSAIDKANVEGSPSESARFTVARAAGSAAQPPPPLTIDALDVRTSILQIKGRTEAGAAVTVNGQRVEVQSDGTFNEFIMLEKVGKQDVKIRVVGINGGIREETRSVVVAY
jgi:hypothetical protein